MVSNKTRKEVWEGLLDAASLGHYFEARTKKYQYLYKWTRLVLIAPAIGGVGALLNWIPADYQLIPSGVLGLLVAWDFIADYAKKVAVLNSISLECSRLENEWSKLWLSMDDDDANEKDIRDKNRELSNTLTEGTARATLVGVELDKKLHSKCEKLAFKVTGDRYAT